MRKGIKIVSPIFVNPFLCFSIIWGIVLVMYNFSPSKLNIPLTSSIVAFVIVAVLCFALIGLYLQTKLKNKSFVIRYRKDSALILLLLIFLYCLEFAYTGYIPILSAGGNNIAYKDFGIPTLHVIITAFSIFYAAYNGFIWLTFRKKYNLLCLIIISCFFILWFNRGMLLLLYCSIICLWLAQKKITIKIFLLTILGVVISTYLFGVLGNIRSGSKWNDTGYFMSVAEIDGDRYSLLAPFYWVEEYLICSLRTLNYNMTFNAEFDLVGFLYPLLPDFISKRLFADVDASYLLLREELTTGTAFVVSYKFGSLFGMFLLLAEYVAVALVILKVRLDSGIKLTMLGILTYCFTTTFFDNSLMYSGQAFAIVMALIYACFKRSTRARRDIRFNRKLPCQIENQ